MSLFSLLFPPQLQFSSECVVSSQGQEFKSFWGSEMRERKREGRKERGRMMGRLYLLPRFEHKNLISPYILRSLWHVALLTTMQQILQCYYNKSGLLSKTLSVHFHPLKTNYCLLGLKRSLLPFIWYLAHLSNSTNVAPGAQNMRIP